jgi:glycosyltransferase involved in cell wall biosynthesis
MKILQVINRLGAGGAEKLLSDSIPLYNKFGTQTDLLLLNNYDSPFLQDLIASKCCNVFILGSRSYYNPLLIFKIIPFLKKYDYLHVHIFPSFYWVAIAKMITFSKTQLIYTEHSTHNRRRKLWYFKFLDKIIYKQYKYVVAITDDVLLNLKNHLNFISDKQFNVINNGVDIELIENAKPYSKDVFGFKETDFLIMQVSRFMYPKDHKTIIKSLLYLPENFKLVFAGFGSLLVECEELIKELGLIDRVHFVGVRTDIPNLIKSVDIVVLSSLYEGMSLSSIEGMASGKPFIASDVDGLRDIVKDAGVLFEAQNEKKFANCVLELYNDKDLYNSVVEKCQLRAKKYDIRNMVKQYIDLYNI